MLSRDGASGPVGPVRNLNPELGVWRVGEHLIIAGETRWVITQNAAFMALVSAFLKSEKDRRRRALPLLRHGDLQSRGLLQGSAIGTDPETADRGRAAFHRFMERDGVVTVVPIDDYEDKVLADAIAACAPGECVYPVRVGAFPLIAGPVFRHGDDGWLKRIRLRMAGRRQVLDLASSAATAICLKPRPAAGAMAWCWMADDLLPEVEAHLETSLRDAQPSLIVAGGDGTVSWDRSLPPRLEEPVTGVIPASGRPADEAVDRYAGPVAGIVGHVSVGPAVPSAPVYLASGLETSLGGFPDARKTPSMAAYLDAREYGSAGYGYSEDAARRSYVFEAVEGYCWLFRGDEKTSQGRVGDFALALSGQDFLALSDSQVEAMPPPVAAVLQAADRSSWIPLRPVPRRPNANSGAPPLWLQAPLMFGCHPEIGHSSLGRLADVNGIGCGETYAAARRHALLEVIERDAVAIWWYAGGPATVVGSNAVCPETAVALNFLQEMNRTVWLLNIPNDFDVRVVVAVSSDREGRRPLFGFGAALRLADAARRASAELYMRLRLVSQQTTARAEGRTGDRFAAWCDTARIDDFPWLSPSQSGTSPPAPAPPDPPEMDAAEEVDWLLDRVDRIGLRAYELDLSRPDVPVPVVRIVVPGCRHFRNRFGPGRRTTVPERLGWSLPPGWQRVPNLMPDSW